MVAGQYVPPSQNGSAFNCPFCDAYAAQTWYLLHWWQGNAVRGIEGWTSATCSRCKRSSMWIGNQMVYPVAVTAPLPHPDMPADVKADFEEAREIVNASPRGAAALLRLGIQKLCADLGQRGKNIDEDIAAPVTLGLPPGVQQALDTVRVTGNEAVHPGTLDLKDNPEMVARLFGLVNFIVEKMITEPTQIRSFYGDLPEAKRDAIMKRDA